MRSENPDDWLFRREPDTHLKSHGVSLRPVTRRLKTRRQRVPPD